MSLCDGVMYSCTMRLFYIASISVHPTQHSSKIVSRNLQHLIFCHEDICIVPCSWVVIWKKMQEELIIVWYVFVSCLLITDALHYIIYCIPFNARPISEPMITKLWDAIWPNKNHTIRNESTEQFTYLGDRDNYCKVWSGRWKMAMCLKITMKC